MTSTNLQTTVELQPYIFFYGRCEEALDFYRDIFGGEYELRRFDEMPSNVQTPAGFTKKVMHATYNGPGFSFMASDGNGEKTIDPEDGNISLSISLSDREAGRRICDRLAEGGSVKMPFQEAFWGGMFATVLDKFGTEWMISTQ
jgi:PhnB protein